MFSILYVFVILPVTQKTNIIDKDEITNTNLGNNTEATSISI